MYHKESTGNDKQNKWMKHLSTRALSYTQSITFCCIKESYVSLYVICDPTEILLFLVNKQTNRCTTKGFLFAPAVQQMMGRSFMAAGLETLSALGASKGISWAAASCSHETTSWMEKVRAEGFVWWMKSLVFLLLYFHIKTTLFTHEQLSPQVTWTTGIDQMSIQVTQVFRTSYTWMMKRRRRKMGKQ